MVPGQQVDGDGRLVVPNVFEFSKLSGVQEFVNLVGDLLADAVKFFCLQTETNVIDYKTFCQSFSYHQLGSYGKRQYNVLGRIFKALLKQIKS